MEKLGPGSFETSFGEIILYLERMLSPVRFQHSLRVARMLRNVARRHRIEYVYPDQATLAGLLHDIAKEMPFEEQVRHLDWFDQRALEDLPPTCRGHEMYVHGPAGAVVASRAIGVESGYVLRAIAQHTGCYSQMDPLARWLHVADFAEPGRDATEREEIERLFFLKDLDTAELIIARWIVRHFPSMDIPVHPFYGQKIIDLSPGRAP